MVILKNSQGVIKKAPVRFSWTTFFFGIFVPLFRGDFKWAFIMFLLSLVVGSLTYGVGSAILSIFFAFKYNEWYLNDLQAKGFRVMHQ